MSILDGVRASPPYVAGLAQAEDAILAHLGADGPIWRIPDLDEEVADVRMLVRLASWLPR